MTRQTLITGITLFVLTCTTVFAQNPSAIRISNSNRTPEVRPIPVSGGQNDRQIQTVQYQESMNGAGQGAPEVPSILTGRDAADALRTKVLNAAPASDPVRSEIQIPQIESERLPNRVAENSLQSVKAGPTLPPQNGFIPRPQTSNATNAQPAFNSQTVTPPTVQQSTAGNNLTLAPAASYGGTPLSSQAAGQFNPHQIPAGNVPRPQVPISNSPYANVGPQDNFANGTNSVPNSNPAQTQFPATPGNTATPNTPPAGNQSYQVTDSIRTQVQPSGNSAAADLVRPGFQPNQFVHPNNTGSQRVVGQAEPSFDGTPEREFDVPEGAMSLETSSPLIKVTTTGPKSISINKPASYRVNISNMGAEGSGSLLIAVELPGHVELADADLSAGTPEVDEADGSSRILWTLSNVAGRSQESMVIQVVPRQPIPFDLDVEWTFVPFNDIARVQVLEPKLAMEITGPSEVQYGEKAIYTITLNNPGTGKAEDVTVTLSESLGGEQASVGGIGPGDRRQFEVELIARDAGQINLGATVTAGGGIEVPAVKPISVRRAKLQVETVAPNFRYAGSEIDYEVTIANVGDSIANNVVAAIALPRGAQYISGVDGATLSENGDAIRWNIGTMSSGASKTYTVKCRLTMAGTARMESAARGDGELASATVVNTRVEALADLTLSVKDPWGPQQVGQEVVYEIHVANRGTKEATNVKLVGQFSPGIEPVRTEGLKSQVVPGSVAFETIPLIPVGSEIVLKVYAKAEKMGTHTFRTELNCEDQDIRRVSEGTTKYFVTPGEAGDTQRVSEGSVNGFSR
jgi:uncharacterized repeat protein (TIGR01451 family)